MAKVPSKFMNPCPSKVGTKFPKMATLRAAAGPNDVFFQKTRGADLIIYQSSTQLYMVFTIFN